MFGIGRGGGGVRLPKVCLSPALLSASKTRTTLHTASFLLWDCSSLKTTRTVLLVFSAKTFVSPHLHFQPAVLASNVLGRSAIGEASHGVGLDRLPLWESRRQDISGGGSGSGGKYQ